MPVSTSCILDRILEEGHDFARGAIIALHAENSTHTDMLPLLRRVADGRRVIVPRSARWSRFGEGGRFSWFTSVNPPLIEPIGFGDGLMQLERLLLDHAAEHPASRDTVVMGIGQGATMALALAALWPELVGRLVAIGGFWPVIPGWVMPDRDMVGVRVLLVGSEGPARERLRELGAEVSEIATADDQTLAAAIHHCISDEPLRI